MVWYSLKFAFAKAWIRFLTSAEYALIPSIKEKSFTLEEKEEALKWIRE